MSEEANRNESEEQLDCRKVARLARVSEQFIFECEHEELVTTRTLPDGRRGLRRADVRRIRVIRHLHEDMGLDLEAVDFVLRYREQIKALKRRHAEVVEQLRRREQEHLEELRALRRRLAEDG
jgi:DNA-binding transcriptional MerR regulator